MLVLTYQIYEKVEEIPDASWHYLAKKSSICFDKKFLSLIETAKINDFEYRYILIFLGEKPIALSTFYTVTTDLAIFSTGFLKSILFKLRKYFPNFLKLKLLECGTPITINPPVIVDKVYLDMAVNKLDEVLMHYAKKTKAFLIVCRDFENESRALKQAFHKKKYHIVDSLPSTNMKVYWSSINQYLDSLKSYYRAKLKKHLKINEKNNIRCECLDDFSFLSKTLSKQWLVVFENASDYQREVLNDSFYQLFSQNLADNSKALIFYKENQIIGHALLLIDTKRLRWLYFGRDKAQNDSLYFLVIYKVIETAIDLKLDSIELGLTTYSIKKDIGALMSENQLAIKAPSRFIHFFVRFFYPLLNHVPDIKNKKVFKNHNIR